MNVPVDNIHHECLLVRNQIREAFRRLRESAASWEPRPMPEDWR